MSWLDDYHWLVYSPHKQGGFCKSCVLFGKMKKGVFGVLVKTPFTNFKRAKGKDGILTNHEELDFHKESTMLAKNFILNYVDPSKKIGNVIDHDRVKVSANNKHILKRIVESILLCGRQNLPLRGHRDDNTADKNSNKGNFLAILQNDAKYDPILKSHLDLGKRNQQYTSKTIQNEIIEVIVECIRHRILNPLQESKYYSVMCDEVTDKYANQEILSLCLRFVDFSDRKHPVIKEVFMDFCHLVRTRGEQIANGIVTLLEKSFLNVDNIRGQSYDGAAAMAGSKSGAQAFIKQKTPLALFTHCNSHVLNLSIAGSSTVQAIRNMIDVINELYFFFDNSPKRQRYLEITLDFYAPGERRTKLKGLCKTRWVERHTCLETVYDLYEYVVTCLDSIISPHNYADLLQDDVWQWDKETRTKAGGLKTSLCSPMNVTALLVMKNGLFPIKGLSAKLQKRDQDIYEAYKHIDFVISEVNHLRQNIDSVWQGWFEEATDLIDAVGGEVCIPRTTRVQRNRANIPTEDPR